MIKYLGSKRTLLKTIVQIVQAVPDVKTAVDLFSGTARVGHALKAHGLCVWANDITNYGATLARCYVKADAERVNSDAQRLIAELQRVPGRAGYFTHTFCERSRFFHPKNGERIDAIREAIAQQSLDPDVEAVLLVSLMEAADRVDSTCGVQMAYLKRYAKRALNDLELRMPHVLNASSHGPCGVLHADAQQAIHQLRGDVIYLDPPYNQHSYLGNYHVWETLVRNDQPEVYGVACKRIDVREHKSEFNSKTAFANALRNIVDAADCRVLLVSFNNEGYMRREQMEALLSTRGPVHVLAIDFKRYVGAQIGIHNPAGRVVGKVSHLRNIEYIYVVDIAGTGVDWPTVLRAVARV